MRRGEITTPANASQAQSMDVIGSLTQQRMFQGGDIPPALHHWVRSARIRVEVCPWIKMEPGEYRPQKLVWPSAGVVDDPIKSAAH